MREKHPIDDRFKALYDAEALPPEQVRAALSERLGWDKSGMIGPAFANTLLLLVGAVGIAFAVYSWSVDPIITNVRVDEAEVPLHGDDAPDGTDIRSQGPIATFGGDGNGDGYENEKRLGLVSTNTENSDEAHAYGRSERPGDDTNKESSKRADPAVSYPGPVTQQYAGRPAEEKNSAGAGSNTGQQDLKPNEDRGKRQHQTNASKSTLVATAHGNESAIPDKVELTDKPNAVPANATLDPKTALAPPEVGSTSVKDQPALLEAMPARAAQDLRPSTLPLLLRLPTGTELSGMPERSKAPVDYVLPNGSWWIGLYVGAGSVKGKWTSTDPEALDNAEEWKNSWQTGLIGGRAWKSGWSVGAGVGMAKVNSRFTFDEATTLGVATDVDTAWVTRFYPSSNAPITTWTIDTLVTPVLGPSHRTETNNGYSVLHVPLNLWWHGQVRRWSMGATVGILGWIPLQREGTTLLRGTNDEGPMTGDLASPELDQRFGPQVHGNAGVSIGYSLFDNLILFAEPMVSAPLYYGDGPNVPVLTRPTFQLRLQHELRSKPH